MDLNLTQQLRATVLLLILSRVICSKGLSHHLQCLNDYSSSINCTLQSDLRTDLEIWLKLENRAEKEELLCYLSWDNDRFYCSVEYDNFLDIDVYEISLCSKEEGCELLDKEYRPVKNIKPKPPCCLTLRHFSNQHHFTWRSTYEEDSDYNDLHTEFTYQLHLNQTRQSNGVQHTISTDNTSFTVQDIFLKPDTEYVARVRSSPNRSYTYGGAWSVWSAPVQWRTPPRDENTDVIAIEVFTLKNLLILVCVLVPVFLSVCFTFAKKWKQQVFIPTPEPYFHTLYTDYHGDFKNWVIMEKTMDLPLTEKTNHIEKIFECENINVMAQSLPEGSLYANMSTSEGVLPDPKIPYAESTSGLTSATASCSSVCLSTESKSLPEGDSGCWLSSDQSLEQSHLWYCNDYCTLSTFQQSALSKANESLKCDTCMFKRHDVISEIHL